MDNLWLDLGQLMSYTTALWSPRCRRVVMWPWRERSFYVFRRRHINAMFTDEYKAWNL